MTARQNGTDGLEIAADYEAPSVTVLGSVVELTQKGSGTDMGGLGGNDLGAGTGGSMQ